MTNLAGARVLVTGADGFIGSHLVERLVGEGCNVVAMAQYNSFGSRGWLDDLETDVRNEIDIQMADLRDRTQVLQLAEGTEAVLHLAALVAIPHSYVAPQSYVDTNVSGTLNVLEAARLNATNGVIVTSTSEVYGTPRTTPITIQHSLNAQSPYAATKIAADQLALSYVRSFDLNVSILRPFNTYGPRQSLRAVIPTLLAQMIAGDEVHIGSLSPRRDFTYVADSVDAFVKLVQSPSRPEVVQIGTGRSVSIATLVELCRTITSFEGKVVVDDVRIRPSQSEVEVLLADPAHAWETISWQPLVELEDGLKMTARWLEEQGQYSRVNEYHR